MQLHIPKIANSIAAERVEFNKLKANQNKLNDLRITYFRRWGLMQAAEEVNCVDGNNNNAVVSSMRVVVDIVVLN